MRLPRSVYYQCASFTCKKDACGSIPGFICQYNCSISAPLRHPGKIKRGRAKHTDSLNSFQGEILGVSVDDFDEDEMVLRLVRQIRIVDRTLVFAPPKGGKTRTVPVSASVWAEVLEHERRFPSVAVALPWLEPGGKAVTVRLLVTGEDGRLYSGDLFSKVVWQGAFRTAELDYEKRRDGMHALRHFYASVLLAQGVSIKELADYLGHSDPGFTLRTYTHLVPSSHERARFAIDGVFGRPETTDGLEAA